MINKYLTIAIQLFILLGVSSTAMAQCGESPVKPDLVDGATTTEEALRANSLAVNAYIADADAFLDCTNEFKTKIAYKSLDSDEKDVIKDAASLVLEERNDIGDEFNDEYYAYLEANPS